MQVALFNDRLVYGRAVVPPPADASWVPVPELTRFANLTVMSLDDTTVRESTLRRTAGRRWHDSTRAPN